MDEFDLRRLRLRSIADVTLRTGDLCQFRGNSLVSSWIRFATHGVHTHSGMIRVDSLRRPDLMEVREFRGGRTVPLLGEVLRQPGLIDVFRPRERLFDLDLQATAAAMRTMTSHDYGYLGIARLAMRRVPLLWRMFRAETRDTVDARHAPFCSHAIAAAYRAGGVDPVPRKPDDLVTPNDLTWSLLFDYLFTLVP